VDLRKRGGLSAYQNWTIPTQNEFHTDLPSGRVPLSKSRPALVEVKDHTTRVCAKAASTGTSSRVVCKFRLCNAGQ